MAQKRSSTVMDQQQPSSSSAEGDYEEASSSEEEDEDEDEPATPSAPAPATNQKPSSKKPLPASAAKSQPPPSPSDDSATESDDGSGSETDDDPPTATVNLKTKPVPPKPFEESPKLKKPKSQPPKPSAAPARSASKRAGEDSQSVNDPKRAKKKVTDAAAAGEAEIPAAEEGGEKKLENDSKKLFQRVWSEEDEIAILKGLAEFIPKTGVDPYKDVNAFHEFIKKSLHWEASSNQLKEKIRRLKKKFENNAGKGKNGEGPKFSKPHEQKAFELSKKVWANEGRANGGVVEKAKLDAKTTKKSQMESSSRNVASQKPKFDHSKEAEKKEEAGQKDIDENGDSTVYLSEMIRFENRLGVSGLNEDVMKRGLQLVGASKRAELEERWKKLQVAELELYVNRAELIKDQAKLILDAYKSSNH